MPSETPEDQLVERLIRAAADAVATAQCERHEEHEYHWHRSDGVAAAAAVLKVLAEVAPDFESLAQMIQDGGRGV